MKKISLLLSVTFVTVGALEAYASGGVAVQSQPQTRWYHKFNPFSKKTKLSQYTSSSYTSSSAENGVKDPSPASTPLVVESPMPTPSIAVEKKPMLPTEVDSMNSDEIEAFKNLLKQNVKNSASLKSKMTSAEGCGKFPGYVNQLAAGLDFYGSNCARYVCSTYCAPAKTSGCWQSNTVREVLCQYRCAQGVVMGGANEKMRACFGSKSSENWTDVFNFWKTKNKSLSREEDTVNRNADEAALSAAAIQAGQKIETVVGKSGDLAAKNAEKVYRDTVKAFIEAVLILVKKEVEMKNMMAPKVSAVTVTAQRLIELQMNSSNGKLDDSSQQNIFKEEVAKIVGRDQQLLQDVGLNTQAFDLTTLITTIAQHFGHVVLQGAEEVVKAEDLVFRVVDTKMRDEVKRLSSVAGNQKASEEERFMKAASPDSVVKIGEELMGVYHSCTQQGDKPCADEALRLLTQVIGMQASVDAVTR